MYLQYQASNQSTENDNLKRTTILFYSLCGLYVLSAAIFAVDIARFVVQVSNNSVRSNDSPFTRSVVQMIGVTKVDATTIVYVIEVVIASCCDFISQSILVCINHWHTFDYSFKTPKDIPLLDRVGSQYPRRDHSFNVGIRIFR